MLQNLQILNDSSNTVQHLPLWIVNFQSVCKKMKLQLIASYSMYWHGPHLMNAFESKNI